MAPSLAAIALYPTEEAAQTAIEALECEGFVIKQILTAPAHPQTNRSADGWGDTPALVSVGLFVSNTLPAGMSVSEGGSHEGTDVPQDAPPVDRAATGPSGHVVIVYNQAKEKAIETLASKEPAQMYRY